MTYEEELVKIKGIGVKTAEDIVRVYPKQESLEAAVQSGTELPFDADVVKLLREHFKKVVREVKNGVWVKSTVGECLFFRARNPHVKVVIGKTPVKVEKRVADFLVNDGTGRIVEVKK